MKNTKKNQSIQNLIQGKRSYFSEQNNREVLEIRSEVTKDRGVTKRGNEGFYAVLAPFLQFQFNIHNAFNKELTHDE